MTALPLYTIKVPATHTLGEQFAAMVAAELRNAGKQKRSAQPTFDAIDMRVLSYTAYNADDLNFPVEIECRLMKHKHSRFQFCVSMVLFELSHMAAWVAQTYRAIERLGTIATVSAAEPNAAVWNYANHSERVWNCIAKQRQQISYVPLTFDAATCRVKTVTFCGIEARRALEKAT